MVKPLVKTIILVSKFKSMNCLNPIQILNQSKVIDLDGSDSLFQYVNCGSCASCQQKKHASYYHRAYYHFKECVDKGGYVLFDTLTYSDKFHPHLKDFDEYSDLPDSLNFKCFNRAHIRTFFKDLRSDLSYLGFNSSKDNPLFTRLVSCEYGSDNRYTHRCHYHLLFFVYDNSLDPYLLSSLISKHWSYGRTDGLPYKSRLYVQENIFRSMSVGSHAIAKYVTKYVMKSSEFQKEIDNRIFYILRSKFQPHEYWNASYRDYRNKLKRVVNQFVLSSHGFGSYAIKNIDIEQLFRRGFFVMPALRSANMITRIPISYYFVRKLCYELITLDDGSKMWSIREDSKNIMDLRRDKILQSAFNDFYLRFKAANISVKDLGGFIDYFYNRRGRWWVSNSKIQAKTLPEKLDSVHLYGYLSRSDVSNFGVRFVTSKYLGSCQSGYKSADNVSPLLLSDCYSFLYPDNPKYEAIIQSLKDKETLLNIKRQNKFDVVQRLQSLYLSF